MRWPQYILSLINLVLALYIWIANLTSQTGQLKSTTFLFSLIYLAIALALCHLHLLYMINKIDDWYDEKSMNNFSTIAVISVLISTIGIVAYCLVEYLQKKTLTMLFQDDDHIKHPIIPLAAVLISSIILFTRSIKFKKYVILCKSDDLPPQRYVKSVPNYRTAEMYA